MTIIIHNDGSTHRNYGAKSLSRTLSVRILKEMELL